MKKDDMIKKMQSKNTKLKKTSIKEYSKMKKRKKKIKCSQCGQIGHSKTLFHFIKPKIEKQIISKHMRVDWKVPMSTGFDVQAERNKYEQILIDWSK